MGFCWIRRAILSSDFPARSSPFLFFFLVSKIGEKLKISAASSSILLSLSLSSLTFSLIYQLFEDWATIPEGTNGATPAR